MGILLIANFKIMASYNFKETTLCKKAFALSMEIFEVSKSFPKEEKYSLTDQVRRSLRSVCVNLAEAYRKKRYSVNFISKLTDCDAESLEIGVWVDFSYICKYINESTYRDLITKNEEVGKLLNHILKNPEKY